MIKVSCSPCQSAGGSITCSETINCTFTDPTTGLACSNVNGIAGGGDTTIGGVTYPTNCLLPTGEPYRATSGSGQGCSSSQKAIVLTFRGATNCVSGAAGVLPTSEAF